MKLTNQTKFKETELGEIPEDWENIVLRNLIEEVIDNRGKTPPLSKDGHEMIEVNAIKDDFVAPDYSVIRKFVDDDTYKNWFRGHIEVGDVLVSTVGTIGNISLIKEKRGVVAQNVIALRPKNRLDSSYLYYYLKSPNQKNELRNLNIGGVQPSIKVPHLLNLQITVPPLPEQQKIAEVLGALDEKIELNRRMNKTLESLAQAVFKKWFIDDADPNWETKKLADIAHISIGRTPPRKEERWFSTNPGDVKWVSIKDMGNCGIFINKTSEFLTDEAVRIFNVPVIPANTTILSFKLTIGRLAITAEKMVSNEAIAHLKLKNDLVSNEYLFHFLRNFDYSSLGSTSSIATAVNSQTIKDIEILIPSIRKLELFSNVIAPIHKRIQISEQEVETLSQIRDSLLPRLMSGKLRVK